MFEICFTRRYSMSHRLFNMKNSRCFVPHGHNEFVSVYLRTEKDSPLDGQANMFAPFEDLKKSWHRWIDDSVDHSLQLSDKDPMLDYFREKEPENLPHILITPGDPTTEALAACFFAKINAFLAADELGVVCHKLEIEETPTNKVIFSGDPKVALGHHERQPWWERADMDINDL